MSIHGFKKLKMAKIRFLKKCAMEICGDWLKT
jgi:hypothetical protein